MAFSVSLPEYQKVFEIIIKDIYELSFVKRLPELGTRLEAMIRYNIPNYSKYRGFLVVLAYSQLYNGKITKDQFHLAAYLGWCYQIIQGYLKLVDEFYDNDQHPKYTRILEFLNTMSLEYLAGQSYDLQTETLNLHHPDMIRFTMENYTTFVNISCKNYTAGMPNLAMLLAGHCENGELWNKVESIANKISLMWKIRDDLIDSFGKNLILPIYHNDIKKGRLTWLIVKANELATPAQCNILKQFYGRGNDDCVEPVIQVYKELRIPELCRAYLKELGENINYETRNLADQGHQIYDTFLRLKHFYSTIKE